jgi:uncharacterized protein (DUF1330 family)
LKHTNKEEEEEDTYLKSVHDMLRRYGSKYLVVIEKSQLE